jgi:hypothetical protein
MVANESKIQLAVAAWENGTYTSMRALAKDFNVSRTTLSNEISGNRLPHQEAFKSLQKLSKIQEQWLTQWIMDEDRKGVAPSYLKTREMAGLVISAGVDATPVGRNWIYSFFERNPSVKPAITRKIDVKRVNYSIKEVIQKHFNLIMEVRRKYNIHDDDVYNFDEHDINQGCSQNLKVAAKAASLIKGGTMKKIPENQEWVSILEVIRFGSKRPPPAIIFKCKTVQFT